MKPSLALFDFDGTITYKDTFLEFIKFYKGKRKFYIGFALLSPLLISFKLKIFPNWKAKEAVLTYFFKGESLLSFQQQCDAFVKEVVPTLLRPKAMEKLQFHISNGDKVVIVSASAENWIRRWADDLNVELIATRLETKNGVLTGKLLGPNCYGPEKVNRIHLSISHKEYENIYAYGDSRGDKELLAFASHPHYRVF